jgi:hypothetical protein
MKHKTVLNYLIYFILLLDASFRARFGPGLGVSALLMVARASRCIETKVADATSDGQLYIGNRRQTSPAGALGFAGS